MNEGNRYTPVRISARIKNELSSRIGLVITMILVLIALWIGKSILLGGGADMSYTNFGSDTMHPLGVDLFDALQNLKRDSTEDVARETVGRKDDVAFFAQTHSQCKQIESCDFEMWAGNEWALRKLKTEGFIHRVDWGAIVLVASACPNATTRNAVSSCALYFRSGEKVFYLPFSAGYYDTGSGDDRKESSIVLLDPDKAKISEIGGVSDGIKSLIRGLF